MHFTETTNYHYFLTPVIFIYITLNINHNVSGKEENHSSCSETCFNAPESWIISLQCQSQMVPFLIHFFFNSSFENLLCHFASLTSARIPSLCFFSIKQLTFAKAIVVTSRERIKACINIHFEQSTRSLWTEATNLCMWLRNLRKNVLDFGVLTDIKVTVWVITIARKNKKQHKAERGYLAYNFRVCSIIVGKSKQELKAWYPESKQRK